MEGKHFKSTNLDKLNSLEIGGKPDCYNTFENMFIHKVNYFITQSNSVFNMNFIVEDEKDKMDEDDFNDSTSSDYSCDDFEEEKKIIRDKEDEIKFDFTKKKRKRIHKTCK
jgi:hypothetical protein